MNYAVIGANYGDCGKGLFTDYLASRNPNHTVVRTNGGAQAGHSVQTPNGDRHVFSHFGSGTLAGNNTHLSKNFIVNPIMFRKEHEKVGLPNVTVSPDALVTIPQDMLLNQLRCEGLYNTCGLGINETMQRSKVSPLFVRSLADMRLFDWLVDQYKALGEDLGVDYVAVIDRYMDDVEYFLDYAEFVNDEQYCFKNLIFEGAQGLGLDQDSEDFPYVTHSKTGSRNMWEVDDTYYITRCYVSRHGAGPLAHEGELTGIKVVDPTNVPNPWQGTMRYAPLDLDILKQRIDRDPGKNKKLVVTCLDQITGLLPIYMDGHAYDILDVDNLLTCIENHLQIEVSHTSYGPTRNDIQKGW